MTLLSKLNKVDMTVQERGSIYGPPEKDFQRVAIMTTQIQECHDAKIRHILYMICVKVCRLIQSPQHHDSWLDIVGYCYTAAMIIDKGKVYPKQGEK